MDAPAEDYPSEIKKLLTSVEWCYNQVSCEDKGSEEFFEEAGIVTGKLCLTPAVYKRKKNKKKTQNHDKNKKVYVKENG